MEEVKGVSEKVEENGVVDLEYLTMNIVYNVKSKEFDITGNIKEEQYSNVLEWWLRGQMGKGADKSERNEREVYHITLKWYPQDDTFTASSDTGNKSLRDGILRTILNRLGEKK